MNEQELKPCPFCGEKVKTSTRPEAEHNGGGFLAFVACYCGGYSATAHKMGHGQTVQEAITDVIAKWNTRTLAQPVSAQPAGEVPEVVGYLLTKGNQLSRMPAGNQDQSLMTIAQHTSIVAALQARAVVMPECGFCNGSGCLEAGMTTVELCYCRQQEKPAGSVMPSRKEKPDGFSIMPLYQEGWNACLDEVARLNVKGGDV